MSTPTPSTFDISNVIDEFLDDYRYGGSPRTLTYYNHHLMRAFVPWLNGYDPEADVTTLTPQHVRAFLADSAKRLAPTTLKARYVAVARFFAWSLEQGYIEDNPVKKVRAPKPPDQGHEAFSAEEARRLVKYAGLNPRRFCAARDRAIMLTLFGTGVRAEELCGIHVADVDFKARRILIHGKGARDRRVPLGDDAARAIRRYQRERDAKLRERNSELPHLWISTRGNAMPYTSLYATLRAVGDAAGVANVHPHRCRHTFAVEFYRRHKDIMAVRAVLGHAHVEQTQTYLRSLGVDYGLSDGLSTPDSWLAD